MSKTFLFVLAASFATFVFSCGKEDGKQEPAPLPLYGADANPTGDSIGGGNGYSKIVQSGDVTVHNLDELLTAFASAKSGDVIYVADGAAIDLGTATNIEIPAGITLAGNRGLNGAPGPLLFSNTTPPSSILFLVEDDVRITGLRFKGPDDDFPNIDYNVRPESGVLCLAVEGNHVEVENCEISNYSRGGVEIYPRGKNVHVHHCHLHDIHSYPVVVLNKSEPPVLVEACRINWIWHATAGSGAPGTGYEARYNLIIREAAPDSWQPYNGQHAIDMHDYLQILQERGHHVAGDFMRIHHNTFVSNAPNDPSVATSYDAAVRGVPRELAEFHHNIFLHSDPAQAIFQLDGNVWVYDNLYGSDQVHIPIALQTTPQILFVNPPPQAEAIPAIGGTINLNIQVNMFDTLQLKQVIVALNGDTLYNADKAPASGDVMINTSALNTSLPFQELTVTAVDSRGIVGRHSTVFTPQ